MNAPIDLDRQVIFKLNTAIASSALARIQKFLLDGGSGPVQLNVKAGVIQNIHITEVVAARPKNKDRRTA